MLTNPPGNGRMTESVPHRMQDTLNRQLNTTVFADLMDDCGVPKGGWSRPIIQTMHDEANRQIVVKVGVFRAEGDDIDRKVVEVVLSQIMLNSPTYNGDMDAAYESMVNEAISRLIKELEEEEKVE
jgi:hypothetical protein